jgi:mitochondrial import inner membrane translocase subunit TIM16
MLYDSDIKHRPEAAMGGDVSGMQTATSGSLTDRLTREHRMTLDEARLILNIKKEDAGERMLQVRFVRYIN